jgi:hypothetical protein
MTALESMFYMLTGERSDPVMSPAPNEIEAVP